MISDSKKRYGIISRALHWLAALLVAWQLLKFGDRIAEGEHWIGQTLVPWHISIGSLLLVLAVCRILWAISQRNNRPAPDQSEAVLVKAGHGLLCRASIDAHHRHYGDARRQLWRKRVWH